MNYPLKFETKEKHISHILNNREFYEDILSNDGFDNPSTLNEKDKIFEEEKRNLELQLEYLRDIISTQTSEIQKQKELLTLKEKTIGKNSYGKGEFHESFIEYILKCDSICNKWVVERCGMKSNDIKLINKENDKLVVSIENKYKAVISKADLTKFNRDHISCNYTKSIFISTSSKIPGIVENINEVVEESDKIYLWCNNEDSIKCIIMTVLSQIKIKTQETDISFFVNSSLHEYSQDANMKKLMKEKDEHTLKKLRSIDQINLDTILRNHLFLVTKSQCKGGRVPY